MAQRLYPLQALLSVRHYREDAARNALRLEERRLVQAREEVGRRQAELERYRIWRQEEEERRYAAILGASLSLEEVADFRASLGMLATGEQERFQAVRQAEEQVRQQEQAVSGAQRAVALARLLLPFSIPSPTIVTSGRRAPNGSRSIWKIWSWRSSPPLPAPVTMPEAPRRVFGRIRMAAYAGGAHGHGDQFPTLAGSGFPHAGGA